MSDELKPCPFCGSHAQDDFIEGESYIIECYGCEASTGQQDGPQAAIDAWNRRAAPPAAVLELIAEVERLSAALQARIEEGKDNA